jgi:hypothetical protein
MQHFNSHPNCSLLPGDPLAVFGRNGLSENCQSKTADAAPPRRYKDVIRISREFRQTAVDVRKLLLAPAEIL